jgi:D-lactate dehydrogenase
LKTVIFNTKPYDRSFLEKANESIEHQLVFLEPRLTRETATLAEDYPAVCIFVNDQVDDVVIKHLVENGTQLLALRCTGFNNVDLKAAKQYNLTVVRVPAYSPHAVAEHTVALLLTLNRKINRAVARVREGNFSLDGLLGLELHGKTVGVIGTGKIGTEVVKIMTGFGCRLIAYDARVNPECETLGVDYVGLEALFTDADIITLHCPLVPQTHHIVNDATIAKMKAGAVLINTSRGGLIDTEAVIRGLKSGKVGHLALDVYEEEADLFFEDLSNYVIQDDTFARLLTFPNVVITGHQAYFTENALQQIAQTTLTNIAEFEQTGSCSNQITWDSIHS